MSFSLYWRPLPIAQPEPTSGYQLKWAIAKRFGSRRDGSKEEPFIFDASVIPWLEGVSDGGNPETAEGAEALIECIQDNSQGVEVWIGESDDGKA